MKKYIKLEDGCRGCNLYGVCYAAYTLNIDLEKCPCSTCLVKMMCKQRCNEFMEFRQLDFEDITLEDVIRNVK